MAGDDSFATVLEQLTAQLHCEHQREVDQLKARIDFLDSQLKRPGPHGRSADADASICSPNGGGLGEHERPTGMSHVSRATSEAHLAKLNELFQMEGASAEKSKKFRVLLPRKSVAFSENMLKSFGKYDVHYSSNPLFACMERIVSSSCFDATFCLLILFNAVVMAFEAQYNGVFIGAELASDGGRISSTNPAYESAFMAFGWFFGVLFTLEIAMRILGTRCKFFIDAWNWLDLTVVGFWIMSMVANSIHVEPQLLRMIRLVRLARLTRLVRRIRMFDALFLMTASLKNSVSILGWTCCLLSLILMLNALLLNQVLVEFYFQNDSIPLEERNEVFRFFGTFTTSLFAMFELTLANWTPLSRLLYERVSEWFIVLTIIHKVTIGFSIVGIINGVFMQETFKNAQLDDELMLRRGRLASRMHANKVKRLVKAADVSGDGYLQLEEFRAIFRNPELKAWMSSLELAPQNVDELFSLLDQGKSGALSIDDMIEGMANFKGTAKNVDLHILMREQRRLHNLIEHHVVLKPGTLRASDRSLAEDQRRGNDTEMLPASCTQQFSA